MALCPHCGESMAEGQEHCYACGQHVRARAFRHERHVNPLVYVGAGLIVVFVLGALLLTRSNAARKQAVLLAEEEAVRVQDSVRRAGHDWQEALRVAQNDKEARSIVAQLEDAEARFQSIRVRVAEYPTVQQESIIHRFEAELELLRQSVVILASAADSEKQSMRDSIQAGQRDAEALMQELGGTE
jgi:hypothetical protein